MYKEYRFPIRLKTLILTSGYRIAKTKRHIANIDIAISHTHANESFDKNEKSVMIQKSTIAIAFTAPIGIISAIFLSLMRTPMRI